MSFAQKLGSSYEQIKDKVKIKTLPIDMGEVKFNLKIRIPIKKEMEAMTERISNPPQEKIQAIFDRLAEPIKKIVTSSGDEFLTALNNEKQMLKITDDDVIIDGSSVKQVAGMTAMWEARVEEYFGMLQSETNDPVNETYEQISEEFPEQVIRQIIENIEAVIKPDYKATKKN